MAFWRLMRDCWITQVPGPDEFPGTCTESADHARGFASFLVVPHQPADHHEVANNRGGSGREIKILILATHPYTQAHAAVVAKIGASLTSLSVYCNKSCIDSRGDDTSLTSVACALRSRYLLLCSVEITHTATARIDVIGLHLGIVMPDLLAGIGIQREQLTGLGTAVDHPVDV
ncbi:hypothetical protein D3C81_1371450 [compost metagenome]